MDQQQSVTFELTADDQVAGAKLSALRVFKRPFRPMTIVLIACVALMAVATIYGEVRSGAPSMAALLPFAPLAAFGLLVYFVTAPAAARHNFRHNKMLHHPIVLSWDATGLGFSSNDNRSRVLWPDLYRVMQNGKVMLFFISPQMMFIVPKRVLTADQIDQLSGYANAR
jgi:hypothetical protein